MHPVNRPGSDALTGGDCEPLWVTRGRQSDGTEALVSEWCLTWRERLEVLLGGRVWLTVRGIHNHPPVALTAASPIAEPQRPWRWLLHAAALLAVLALLVAARTAHADDLEALAAEAGVDVVDLAGAVNTTGMEPRAYLCSTGELDCAIELSPGGVTILGPASLLVRKDWYTGADVRLLIRHYASVYGASSAQLERVAACESVGWNERVINGLWLGRAGEVGVFQFHPQGIWLSVPASVKRGRSRYDVHANVEAAAWAFSRGQSRHWSCA
jgi:hypothetical protein